MAPIADPADIGLSDILAHGGGVSGNFAAWAALALFLAALLAIWDDQHGLDRVRRRDPGRPRGTIGRRRRYPGRAAPR